MVTVTQSATLAQLKATAAAIAESLKSYALIKSLGDLAWINEISEDELSSSLLDIINAKANSDDVTKEIAQAVSKSGHARFEVANSVPSASEAEENVLYLVKNADTGYYDIYALIGSEVVRLDDTTVNLDDYVTNDSLKTALEDYYTSEQVDEAIKEAAYTHPTYTSYENGLYKVTVDDTGHVSEATSVTKADISELGVAITDTTYDEATATKSGLMSADDKEKLDSMEIAADEEFAEMLADVFC